MEGKDLCDMSSSTSEMWEKDKEWMQSSTRFAPSCFAFSMEAIISSLVSHSSVVQMSRSLLKPIERRKERTNNWQKTE